MFCNLCMRNEPLHLSEEGWFHDNKPYCLDCYRKKQHNRFIRVLILLVVIATAILSTYLIINGIL